MTISSTTMTDDSSAPNAMQSSVDADKTACIVCLVDLPDSSSDLTSGDMFDQIARLVPCNHAMHNSCLAPWVERANSCPICRQNFNRVKLSITLTGKCIVLSQHVMDITVNIIVGPQTGEYEVEDRIQRVDHEQNFLEMDLFEEPQSPCLLCSESDNEEVMLLCDGCDGPFHTYCCELNEVPQGTWYCPFCLNLEAEPTVLLEEASGQRGRSRAGGSNQRSSLHSETRRARPRRRTQRNASVASRVRHTDSHGSWARVWHDVWSHRTRGMERAEDGQEAEEAALREWNRRAEIAQAQGDGYSGFRAAAPSIVAIRWSRPRERVPVDSPASPEAIAAWGAFDEFRRQEARKDQSTSRKRRPSKVSTPSPKDILESTQPERKHKRPRTRPSSTFTNVSTRELKVVTGLSTPSVNAEQRTSVFGSWLSKLDGASALDGGTTERSDHGSPPSCTYPTPRVTSTSPTVTSPKAFAGLPTRSPSSPPWSRPHSPVIVASPVNGPCSPTIGSRRSSFTIQQIHFDNSLPPEGSPILQPAQPNLSLKSKEEIQSIVRAALRPHYKSKKVSTEQYTEINKVVSRHLYQIVGSPGSGFSLAFSDEEMERLKSLAENEVKCALESYC